MITTQINLQKHFGGGEVYTTFLCHALDVLGVETQLFVHRKASFWSRLGLPASTALIPVSSMDEAATALHYPAGWIITHGTSPQTFIAEAKVKGALVTAIAHMPVQGRDPKKFLGYDRIFAVSDWVLQGLMTAGLPAWPEPLYGVANLARQETGGQIRRTSRYDWDLRKGRDRLLSWFEPLVKPLSRHPLYTRKPGLTLGIVSRLTPIKQFPLLFQYLAPVLTQFPDVQLEIFGSGGYRSVRDLSQALRPIAGRVRFWGHQRDVAAVYHGIDYLLTGLPEKEALGLNVIEAQACGTPVLAPNAPPFTETVVDGVTGFLYTDPRVDQGNAFRDLISRLRNSSPSLDPRLAADHLARFTMEALTGRLRPVVAWAAERTDPLQASNTQ